MKKLLLFAIGAFIGINAQAQDKPEVITQQPAGTEIVYKRVSGKMFYYRDGLQVLDYANLIANDQQPGDLRIITAADGKTVYLKYVLSYASYIRDDLAGGWVKGTKKGNKITIPAGQYILYGNFDDGEYGLRVGYMEYKKGKFVVSDEQSITFTLDGNTAKLDGTYMEGEIQNPVRLKLLGAYWSDDKSFFCGDVETLCSTVSTGIGTIEESDNMQVVGETYFDLSGRKLSKAGKGLVIKSIKYADGTTKTVKYINK